MAVGTSLMRLLPSGTHYSANVIIIIIIMVIFKCYFSGELIALT